MSRLSFKQCRQPIKFDDKHISRRTGKKILLDIDTDDEPHDCPIWKNNSQQQQKSDQSQ